WQVEFMYARLYFVFMYLTVLKFLPIVLETGMLSSKMSRLNLLSVSLSFLLLSRFFLQEHPDGEDHIHASVVVFVVVVLVRYIVDALELVRITGSHDDLVGVALAVPLDPREVPYGAKEDLVNYYGVVAAVVELCQLGTFPSAQCQRTR
ncbi:MAG: hypothetical protein ACKO96_44460, partial [Flammeovirgaceae bacterium]